MKPSRLSCLRECVTARTDIVSLRRTFLADDQLQLFNFTISSSTTVTFHRYGFGGGTNAAGDPGLVCTESGQGDFTANVTCPAFCDTFGNESNGKWAIDILNVNTALAREPATLRLTVLRLRRHWPGQTPPNQNTRIGSQ
jgi:hypothetical protein